MRERRGLVVGEAFDRESDYFIVRVGTERVRGGTALLGAAMPAASLASLQREQDELEAAMAMHEELAAAGTLTESALQALNGVG